MRVSLLCCHHQPCYIRPQPDEMLCVQRDELRGLHLEGGLSDQGVIDGSAAQAERRNTPDGPLIKFYIQQDYGESGQNPVNDRHCVGGRQPDLRAGRQRRVHFGQRVSADGSARRR